MSDKADNHLVAAHLAAALVLKLERTSLPAKDAVSLYFEVLKTLEEEQDARNSAGVNPNGRPDSHSVGCRFESSCLDPSESG